MAEAVSGGYTVIKLVLLAPNIDGTDVGEALMAFKWAEALSQRTELTVLTFQRPGRAAVAQQLPQARVITWPEPGWAMKHERLNAMLKPAWPIYAAHVRRWMRAALGRGERFDIAHQLMPQAARYPSPLRHFAVPYVIGPLGGALNTPPHFGPKLRPPRSSHGCACLTKSGSVMIHGCAKAMRARPVSWVWHPICARFWPIFRCVGLKRS